MANSREAKRTLGIFAKEPTPGNVKTRLATATSPDWAAKLYDAMLRDLLDRLQPLPYRKVIAYSPATALQFFEALAANRFELVPQLDGDLGRRLRGFIQSQHDEGTKATVIIGSDSPNLPLEYIDRAFQLLENHEVVLGSATDGGFYLLGSASVVPDFANVAWGTSGVLRQTIQGLDSKLGVALLPPWYDVDTLEDLEMLWGHLIAELRSGIDPKLDRTRKLIADES